MDRYKETFETWNKVAALYQDKFMYLDLYNDTYDVVSTSITKQHAKILDVGCGPGNITKYLLSKRPDFDILGIDIAPKMIEFAKTNNPTANFAVMDSRDINTLKTKYDAIMVGFCLPYLSQAESNKLISDTFHLLNDNGLLYLSFVEGDPTKSEFKTSSEGRVYFHFHNLDNVKSQLIESKFIDLKVFKVDYKRTATELETHTIVTARKPESTMTKTHELASRLREVILNGTWIANTNFKDQLEHLDWKIATTKMQSLNTISVLAQHIHYYIVGIKNVFINGKLDISDKYSFDFPPIESQTQWESFLTKFWNDTEQLAQLIEQMPEAQLNDKFVDEKYGSYQRNIDGMIEHSYYHLGQIVLLKKVINE